MRILLVAMIIAFGASCGGSGYGKAVREDVTRQMTGAQGGLSTCYQEALKRNGKLQGTLELTFSAAADTGQFSDVTVSRDDVGDDELATCVVNKVSQLKLEAAQKTKVAVTYPLDFEPSN